MNRYSALETPPLPDAFPREQIFVPVDGSTGAERALALAIEVAKEIRGEIVLVGLLPDYPGGATVDPDVVRALLIAEELGIGGPAHLQPLDDEERTSIELRYLLLPLQRRAQAADVPAAVRILRGENLTEQLRDIVASEFRGRALVLSNPLQLFDGALRDLTNDLITGPPCTLYLTGLDQPECSFRDRAIRWLMRKLWHPRTSPDGV